MNLRNLPSVKNKLSHRGLFIVLVIGALFSFYLALTDVYLGILIAILFLPFVFFHFYNLSEFRKFLKNIESGNCIVLQGRGNIVLQGRNPLQTYRRSYFLEVTVINSDGTETVYTSDALTGKLDLQVSAIKSLETILTDANEKFSNKVASWKYNVYLDKNNPKKYFVDISPLYIFAEQI